MGSHPCPQVRERKQRRRLETLSPPMHRARLALERGPLTKAADGDFRDQAGARHLFPVVAALARRGIAVIETSHARKP